MANTNLFYLLYSKSNDKIMAPYICSSAVDEHDTSFDISNDTAVITDSNGKELASIDLSNIHANDISQYGVETQILEPGGYYVLEGKYYGEAYASYFYKIPKIISETLGYEKYLTISFDIIFGNWKRKFEHCRLIADGSTNLDELINAELQNLKISVNATIQTLQDLEGNTYDYLVFTAEEKKYFFYLRNLLVKVCFQNEDYINSPFNNYSSDNIKEIIVNAINEYKPRLNGTYDKEDPYYNELPYELDCNLYTWILVNYEGIRKDLHKFDNTLEKLNNPNLTPEEVVELNKPLEYTVYNSSVIQDDMYDFSQLCVIRNMLHDISDLIVEDANYYPKQFWLQEDISKRITFIKYPNGAYKGIVIVPDYPKNEQFQYDSLLIHHIQDIITVYEPTHNNDILVNEQQMLTPEEIENEEELSEENPFKVNTKLIDPVFKRKVYGVVSNVDFAKENEHFTFNWDVAPGCEAVNTLSCCYPEYFMTKDISIGQHQQKANGDVMSLTNYIKYLNDNNLWTKFGHFYAIVGKNDNPQEHTKNYVTSILIHNPNNIPIRIKYLTFS